MWTELGTLAFGCSVALIIAYLLWPWFDRFFSCLSSPIATISRRDRRPVDMPVVNGLVCLGAVYFVTGLLFAFTGGTVGSIFADLPVPGLFVPRSGMTWGFIVGLLVAGFARIRGVTSPPGMISELSLLGASAVASVVVTAFVDYRVFTIVSDKYLKDHFLDLPRFGLIAAPICMLAVEGIVYVREGGKSGSSRHVTGAAVRHRIESYQTVEQVFLPQHVVPATNALIERTIRQGMTNVSWLTNTAPESHLRAIQAGVREWAEARCADTVHPNRVMQTLIGANMRVIVPSMEVRNRVRDALPWVKEFRITRVTMRMRLLILNRAVAIMHLPVPYNGQDDEEANCAAISEDKWEIHQLQGLFDDIWEHTYGDNFHNRIAQLVVGGRTLALDILLALMEVDAGMTLRRLTTEIRTRARGRAPGPITPPTEGDVRAETVRLADERLVFLSNVTGRYVVESHCNKGQKLDFLRRLVEGRYVDLMP